MIFRRRRHQGGLYNLDELLPPEGVPLKLRIASVGVRLAAQITDLLITVFVALAIIFLVAAIGWTRPDTLYAITAMLFFIIRVPYYIVSEVAWNGQTPGKRFMKIKVVANDGKSLTVHALVVRNLMKEAEIFLPGTLLLTLDAATPIASGVAFAWVLMAILVPLTNHRRRRLGDFIAGTYVIHLPQPVLLEDLSQSRRVEVAEREDFVFLSHHLDHYGAFELQTLEDLLRGQQHGLTARQKATAAKIVENIRRKIDYADQVPAADHIRFLTAFYNAQRAYLEQRQLFGESRADKFHADKDPPS